MNYNHHGRAGLKEANRCVSRVRRLVSIEPEVIQGAEANRVGVLVLRKSFCVPSYRIGSLSDSPRCAAITLVVECAVVCPAGMLNRRMKSDVRDVYSGSKRHAKGLNSAIEVLVIQGILIVPDPRTWITDFVTHEPDAIVAWVRFGSIHGRACPGHDGRLFSHAGAHPGKRKRLIDSGYVVTTVRSVVIHVALPRMTLAPGVFMRDDVFGFGKINRARV